MEEIRVICDSEIKILNLIIGPTPDKSISSKHYDKRPTQKRP